MYFDNLGQLVSGAAALAQFSCENGGGGEGRGLELCLLPANKFEDY